MAILTVRNLPDEVHRALLEESVKPQGRLKLGSLLADIGRRMKLTDGETALITSRDTHPPRTVDVE